MDGEQRRVDEDSIFYLEARRHTVLLETAAGPITVKVSLSALAHRMGTDFIPTHRSFLVKKNNNAHRNTFSLSKMICISIHDFYL